MDIPQDGKESHQMCHDMMDTRIIFFSSNNVYMNLRILAEVQEK